MTFQEIAQIMFGNFFDERNYPDTWLKEKLEATRALRDYGKIKGMDSNRGILMVARCLCRIEDELSRREEIMLQIEAEAQENNVAGAITRQHTKLNFHLN